ncbi:MAG: secreted PhoX family phosphatase [Sulfurimonas sp.]|jgi:secreted PhoX family phosphatase|uniref:PhoX family protein n=1 Tax=Sulfurimonas sp. TaxID=2022749 RepID=UPI0039E5C10A
MYKISIAASIALASLTIVGCSSDGSQEKEVKGIAFTPVELSSNDTQKRSMRVSDTLTVSYTDNTTQEYPLTYKTLAKMGDTIGTGTIGLMTDKNDMPILKSDGSQDISDGPDGNSLINVGGKSYLVTHMEERPGELYNTELTLENGALVPVETKPVDLSAIGGTIINCASSKTTYGSHLGGEEDYSLNSIFADTASPFYADCALDGTDNDTSGESNYFCSYVNGMQKYLGDTNIDKTNGYNGDYFSPYNYGYIVEVQPQADGTTKSSKHYVTGKYTPELAAMMPDGKTVYMSDDGTAKGFWKFVSDTKIDSFKADWEGTLYAAKVAQTSAENGGSFDLSWVELGHAKDSEVKALIDSKMKLTDIFEIAKPDAAGTCATDFTRVYEDSTIECLKLVPGQEKAAAFLESRKYAAYKGATTEFRKEEGLTYDKDSNSLYVAMSSIEKSMEDNYKGTEPANDIKLAKNICGAVYKVSLDADYSGTKMEAIVVGKPLGVNDNYADEWTCSPEGISNPDNITYIGHNTLLISEDTTKHVNNMSWAYNTVDKTMTRIASLPIGGEVTGVDTGVVGNKGFLLINTQHPFKDNPKAADGTKPNSALIENATDEQLKAEIGYIDGIPSNIFQ